MSSGPVKRAIRGAVGTGQRLATPVRAAAFIVESIDGEGVVLGLGAGRWRTRLSWSCLEGILPFLAGKGWVEIGSRYEVEGKVGTLDGYLMRCVKRATGAWVAALLETAGLVDVLRSRPAKVRLQFSRGPARFRPSLMVCTLSAPSRSRRLSMAKDILTSGGSHNVMDDNSRRSPSTEERWIIGANGARNSGSPGRGRH